MSNGHTVLFFAGLAAANEACGNHTWWQIGGLIVVGVAWILKDWIDGGVR